ncbi:STAS domain-containing protein [Streptomyces sp. DT24]|uniref:STAS domain-containing protein n=1 Tax=Streptomyces sp. DT24 TaxID=3416520 RepID=UPI003CF32681
MTTLPRPPFTITVEAGPGTVQLRLVGDLDYETSDELVRQVEECLADHPHPRDLRLNCAQLQLCDSMGVSALLLTHRRTDARGVRLHLDNPPSFLERILEITGTRQLFMPAAETHRAESAHTDESS